MGHDQNKIRKPSGQSSRRITYYLYRRIFISSHDIFIDYNIKHAVLVNDI